MSVRSAASVAEQRKRRRDAGEREDASEVERAREKERDRETESREEKESRCYVRYADPDYSTTPSTHTQARTRTAVMANGARKRDPPVKRCQDAGRGQRG